jgi:hypothetical protein
LGEKDLEKRVTWDWRTLTLQGGTDERLRKMEKESKRYNSKYF